MVYSVLSASHLCTIRSKTHDVSERGDLPEDSRVRNAPGEGARVAVVYCVPAKGRSTLLFCLLHSIFCGDVRLFIGDRCVTISVLSFACYRATITAISTEKNTVAH